MELALLWSGGCFGELQSRRFAPGDGQIESDALSKHTLASRDQEISGYSEIKVAVEDVHLV